MTKLKKPTKCECGGDLVYMSKDAYRCKRCKQIYTTEVQNVTIVKNVDLAPNDPNYERMINRGNS